MKCLVLSIIVITSVLCAFVDAQACSGLVNQFYSASCTNPNLPYCASLKSGIQCSQCVASKTTFPMCDCLGNQWCTPDQQSGNMNTCVAFPLGTATCTKPTDCPQLAFIGTSTQVVGYWSCVNNNCAICNQTAYPTPIVCPGGSPYPASSHAGVIVYCNNSGWWQQNGTATIGTTTTQLSSTSSGNSAVGSLLVLVLLVTLIALL